MADDSDKLGTGATRASGPRRKPDRSDEFRTEPLGAIDPTDPLGHEFGLPDDETGYLPLSDDSLPIIADPSEDRTSLASISDAAIRRRTEHNARLERVRKDATVASGLLPAGSLPDGPPPQIYKKRPAAKVDHPAPMQPRRGGPTSGRPKPGPPVREVPKPFQVPDLIPTFSPTEPDPPKEARQITERTERVRRIHASLVAGFLTVVWLAIVAWLTTSRWMHPNEALRWSLAGLGPILVASVVASLPRGRKPALRELGLAKHALGGVVAALFIVPLSWQFGPVRGAARSLADESLSVARAVLLDRDDVVSAKECARLAPEYPRPDVGKILVETLAGRPEVVRSCLKRSADIAALLSNLLVEAWQQQLLDGEDSERACDIAKTLVELDRQPGEVESRLVSCVIHAPDEVQRCCVDALALKTGRTADWVAGIQIQGGYVPDERTAAALLAATFRHDTVTEAQRALLEEAAFGGTEHQRLAIVLGCAAMKAKAQVGQAFVGSLPRDCPVDGGKLPADNAAWLRVCVLSHDRLIRRRKDPEAALCLAARAMAVQRASAQASEAVIKAKNRRKSLLRP